MKLGYAFREMRLKKFPNREKKQFEIAAEAGISQTFLSQIEGGSKEPSIPVIKSLCKVYDVPPAILFWMAMEPNDVKKGKRSVYKAVKHIVDNIVDEFVK